jgi:hypothetical protein
MVIDFASSIEADEEPSNRIKTTPPVVPSTASSDDNKALCPGGQTGG